MTTPVQRLTAKTKKLKRDVMALYMACKRPDVPWYAKLVAMAVVGYAFSPIDLIPDFIPVLGYLDDLILIPLGVWLVIKLIPVPVMEECRLQAEQDYSGKSPRLWTAGVFVILIWISVLGWLTLIIADYWFAPMTTFLHIAT